MSSINAPFGLRPSYSTSGILRPEQLTIASGYASNIFQFSPIKIFTDGTLQVAAPADRIIGVFMGVEFTDAEGRRRYSNRWLSGTIATDIVAYTMRDQQPTVYEIQADGPLTVANIGNQANFEAVVGSTVSGLSTQRLTVASLTPTANAALRILGISTAPDNVAGDLFTIARVQISRHQDVADQVAY